MHFWSPDLRFYMCKISNFYLYNKGRDKGMYKGMDKARDKGRDKGRDKKHSYIILYYDSLGKAHT